MIKPAGAQCNLDCTYCFYQHKEGLLHQAKTPRMSDEVLEAHISQYIKAQSGPEVIFTWQGGEPTLMGLEFFEKVIELQKKYKRPFQRVENDLQTNGVLLDDKWCEFLKKHNFLVGISIDGPAHIHDKYRIAKGGQPTFDRVMRAIGLLRQHEITFNALCVVNDVNSKQPLETYRFLRDEVRPRVIQFIPGVEPVLFKNVAPDELEMDSVPRVGDARAKPKSLGSVVTDWSVNPDDWGDFLSKIWDEWFANDFGNTFVDQFENVVSILYGKGSQMCVTAPKCGRGVAIEYNGDVYSCDHFVYPKHKLGNILETEEGILVRGERQIQFGEDKFAKLTQSCRQCPVVQICWGECPKNRFIASPEGESGHNYLCNGLKKFFGKAAREFPKIRKRLGN